MSTDERVRAASGTDTLVARYLTLNVDFPGNGSPKNNSIGDQASYIIEQEIGYYPDMIGHNADIITWRGSRYMSAPKKKAGP